MFSRQKWLGDIWTLYQCSVASLPRWQIVEKEEVSQKRERRGIRFQEVSETSQEMFFGHRARLWIFWMRISGRNSQMSYWVALSKWKPLISFGSCLHHWTTILKSVCQFPTMESRNGKLPLLRLSKAQPAESWTLCNLQHLCAKVVVLLGNNFFAVMASHPT